MPTFQTPEPIAVQLDLGHVVATVGISAGERTDTTVEVRPAAPESKTDTKIADQTRIEYADGRLVVRAPRLGMVFGRTGAITVALALPAGSQLQGEVGMGELRCEGRLGACRYRTGYGDVSLDHVGAVTVHCASGDVTVNRADGGVEIKAGNGAVNLGRVDGPATVGSSNGATRIGEVVGDLRYNGANGKASIDRAHAGVTARTANGSIRVGEVLRGAVTLETAAGSLEVGIGAGTAAWLDLHTGAGNVRNELAETPGPDGADETVEVRARTYLGDITVRRAGTDRP